VTIEVQCTSCHTRYRIDEQVLPEGTPTFKCSRCGHVFTLEPRGSARIGDGAGSSSAAATPGDAVAAASSSAPPPAASAPAAPRAPRNRRDPRQADSELAIGEKSAADSQSGWVVDSDTVDRTSASATNDAAAQQPTETTASSASTPSSSEEKGPSTEELLSKPFRDEESSSGENLRFDFNDDHAEHEMPLPATDEIAVDRHGGEWQVGEAAPEALATADPPEPQQPLRKEEATANPSAAASSRRRVTAAPPKSSEEEEREEFIDEDAAPIYNRSVVTHSARFFVALFALFAIGYGAMAVLIRSAPATAAEMLSHLPKIGDRFIPPIAPARLVAMRDVHSDYLRTKGGHNVLVVTGIAENVGGRTLHGVQIAARLRDPADRTLASRAVYCGNNLSAPMVAQMTPHELEFFQKLDPPKTFALEPSATSPFVIVFIDPPSAVNRFDVSVASAEASAPPPPDSGE
jgi:predicted Zn finger-like uncharacterized protein